MPRPLWGTQIPFLCFCRGLSLKSGSVARPSFELKYWILGSKTVSEQVSTVRIAGTRTVSALKKEIVLNESTFVGMAASSLKIWKVSIPMENLAKLENIRLRSKDGIEELASRQRLTTFFPNPPVEGHLHIIVQPPSSEYKVSWCQMCFFDL